MVDDDKNEIADERDHESEVIKKELDKLDSFLP